jgi:hypothetical protein
MAVNAREVKTAVRNMWAGTHGAFTEAYLGSASQNARRVDVVALEHTWKPPCVKIAEVKVRRSDFLGDSKWVDYLPFCNKFYWACPTGLLGRDEIDGQAGLIMVNADSGTGTVVKAAPYRDADPEALYYLCYYLLTWRTTEHQVRDKRMAAIRKELSERKDLGDAYSRYVANTLNEASRRVREVLYMGDLPSYL